MPVLGTQRRTLGAIRTHVRDVLDLTETDMPDGIMDPWVIEGFRRIVRAAWGWPGYRVNEEFEATAGVGSYDFVDIAIPEEIGFADRADRLLEMIPWSEGRTMIPATGTPRFYSLSDRPAEGAPMKVYLWPVPSGTYDLFATGWRDPNLWYTGNDNDTPDFHPDFDEVLLNWVLYRAYLREDEGQQAQAAKVDFGEGVNQVAIHVLSAPGSTNPSNMVVGGHPTPSGGPKPPVWPFDVYGRA